MFGSWALKTRKNIFILFSILTLTACSNVNHYTLGPIANLEHSDLPLNMLPAASIEAREKARIMVLWLLQSDIKKTKSDPPAMLRGLAYLEYVLNDLLNDLQISVTTKKSMKTIVLNLRDALGMPLHNSPEDVIRMYWSTAKFMEINKFSKIELAEPILKIQENLSKIKSSIGLAIITAKLNMIINQNRNISRKLSTKKLTFRDDRYIDAEHIDFSMFRKISAKRAKEFPPQPWSNWSKDFEENLNTIASKMNEKEKFFLTSTFNYEKDLFRATEKVFRNILIENQNSWIRLQRLQKLSDFLTLATLRLPKKLVVNKKRSAEVQRLLRALTPADYDNLREFLIYFSKMKTLRLKTFQKAYNKKHKYLLPAIQHMDKYKIDLNKMITETKNVPIEQIASLTKLLANSTMAEKIGDISDKIIGSSQEINGATNSLDSISSELSYAAGQYLAAIGADLQTAADSIASAIQSGISTDLNAVAQGMGFSSFADAVAAYNAQYGTNYSVQQAREALAGN